MTILIQLAASIALVVTGFVLYFVFLAMLMRMIACANTRCHASVITPPPTNALSAGVG